MSNSTQKLLGNLALPLTFSFTPLAVWADPNPNSGIPSFTLPSNCNDPPINGQKQYIIGYGSLMQEQSRLRTSPNSGVAYPVMVTGYRRGWYAQGKNFVSLGATFLGIIPDPKSQFNAVLYQIKDQGELLATDRRETIYCRLPVSSKELKLLVNTTAPDGQVWIYVNRPENLAIPNAKYPIVQSYVDIFLSGCLEQEEKYNLTGFAKQCIQTTQDWSVSWVNDRIYPRRPFLYQPKANQIDKLINDNLPDYFQQIKIE